MKTVIEMAREAGAHPSHNPDLYDIWSISDKALERFAELVRADEAEKYKWDIHSCGPTCTKVACVAMREAVEAEREACQALHQHEDVLAPVGNSAWGEAYQEGWAAGTAAYLEAIRARSNT